MIYSNIYGVDKFDYAILDEKYNYLYFQIVTDMAQYMQLLYRGFTKQQGCVCSTAVSYNSFNFTYIFREKKHEK